MIQGNRTVALQATGSRNPAGNGAPRHRKPGPARVPAAGVTGRRVREDIEPGGPLVPGQAAPAGRS